MTSGYGYGESARLASHLKHKVHGAQIGQSARTPHTSVVTRTISGRARLSPATVDLDDLEASTERPGSFHFWGRDDMGKHEKSRLKPIFH